MQDSELEQRALSDQNVIDTFYNSGLFELGLDLDRNRIRKEDFRWAVGLVRARGFQFNVPGDKERIARVAVPMMDHANHGLDASGEYHFDAAVRHPMLHLSAIVRFAEFVSPQSNAMCPWCM
jgi:hypothetical protein